MQASTEDVNLQGPQGKTGLSGPTGPPMKDWMPPEDYAVMLDFIEGRISYEQLKDHARKVLSRP